MTEREILIKTLYFEAGVCNMFETIKVAWLIRNRVEANRKYFGGNNYTGVCLKKWQFSCWNKKDINDIENIKIGTNSWWRKSIHAAEYVMEANPKENPIKGALYYYEPTLCCPKWAKKMKRLIPLPEDKHIFLKEV